MLPSGAHSPYAPVLGLVGALMVGGLLATGFEGVAMRARSLLLIPGLRAVDGLLGAGLTACVALGVAWIVGAIAVQTSGSSALQRDIQGSVILRTLNQVLPPSGPILHALARFDPLPSVHGPSAEVAAPTPAILAAPGVRAARRSWCASWAPRAAWGSRAAAGWPGPGSWSPMPTSSPVRRTRWWRPTGGHRAWPRTRSRSTPTTTLPSCGFRVWTSRPCASPPHPRAGTAAAILGYPLDGPFDAEPGRIGQTETVNTQDAYGNGPIQRSITTLRGYVRPGNSGGPLVDGAGEVVGTVFAAIVGAPGQRGGFAVPNELVTANWPMLARRPCRPARAPDERPRGRSQVSGWRSGSRPSSTPGRAVVCTPPAPRCYAPGRLSASMPPTSSAICTTMSSSSAPTSSGW